MVRTFLAAALLVTAAPFTQAQEPAQPSPEPKPEPASAPADPEDPKPAATNDTPSATLPELVVTPTRRAVDPFEVPAPARALSGADAIERRGARTVPEAAGQLPGVGVQKTAQGQGTIFMRGLTGFRTLMLLDGVRLNNSIMRDGPNEYLALIDPYLLDRLEVVDGPGSVLYGSDAVGGSINLRTRRPTREKASGYSRRLAYRYSTADQSHSVRAEAGGWTEEFGIRAGGTWRDFDDLEGGRHTGTQARTGFQSLAGDVAAEWALSDTATLRATVMHLDMDDIWRTHKTVFATSWHGTTVGNERARVLNYERTHGALHLEASPTEWLTDMRVSVSGSRLVEEQDRTRSDGRRDVRFIRVNTAGIAAHASTPLTALGEGAQLLYGFDWYHDDVDSGRQDYAAGTGLLSSTKIQGSVADDARYDLVGAFLQWEQPITAWLAVHGGLRFTWADVYAGAVQDPVTSNEISLDDTFTNLSNAGQILLRPAEGWRLYTALGQSFRAPNLSDLTRLDTARSGELEVASPGLDPEHYLTWEIGTKLREAGFEAEALYFYTWITDQIVRTPTGTMSGTDVVVTKSNVGDGYVQGASGQMSYRIPEGMFIGWKVTGGASWQEGAVDTYPTSAPVSEREPLSKLPPASGYLRLGYEPEGAAWWVEAEAKAARSQERLSTADNRDTQRIPPGGTPGYAVFALRGGFTPMKGLKVNVGLENLGDRDYRYHGSGVNEAGFHAVLSFIWDF
jgi:hemoglobin/transferrin/lactoferrin receptor protein